MLLIFKSKKQTPNSGDYYDPTSCNEPHFQPPIKPLVTLPLDNYTVPPIEFTYKTPTKPLTKKPTKSLTKPSTKPPTKPSTKPPTKPSTKLSTKPLTKPPTKKQDGCFFVAKRQSHTSNGRHQKGVSSLEKCKEACKAQKDCKAIDWDPSSVKQCWTHSNPKPKFHPKFTVYMLICRELPFVFGATNIIKAYKIMCIVWRYHL